MKKVTSKLLVIISLATILLGFYLHIKRISDGNEFNDRMMIAAKQSQNEIITFSDARNWLEVNGFILDADSDNSWISLAEFHENEYGGYFYVVEGRHMVHKQFFLLPGVWVHFMFRFETNHHQFVDIKAISNAHPPDKYNNAHPSTQPNDLIRVPEYHRWSILGKF